jgi:hypothetical protein
VLTGAAALAGLVVLPGSAGAVTVAKAELKGGQLRLDGANAFPGVFVTVESAASSAGARSDSAGAYHVTASGFRSDDCKVVVSDRQTFTATVPLAGCTPTPATVPADLPAPTGSCSIDPPAGPARLHVGDLQTVDFTTTGCTGGPLSWTLRGGHLPTGMSGPTFQGSTAGHILGTPTVEGSYTFQLLVRDGTGATDAENFAVTVDPPRPLTITTPSLAAGTAGHAYRSDLGATGGLPGYQWTLRTGTLPAGLKLTSTGSIAGTPTTPGTSTFTARVTESRGTTTDATSTLTIS